MERGRAKEIVRGRDSVRGRGAGWGEALGGRKGEKRDGWWMRPQPFVETSALQLRVTRAMKGI